MADLGLLVGINKYPYPNMLRGCIDDNVDLKAGVVEMCKFNAKGLAVIQDKKATTKNIKTALVKIVGMLKPGDRFLFQYSGHGAQMTDVDISTDCVCPWDFDWSPQRAITVADFHAIFEKIPAGVTALWISDSCHSGDLCRSFYGKGVPRMFYRDMGEDQAPIPPADTTFRTIANAMPNIALVSGCQSNQTSADAYINGRYNGALTYFLLQVLRGTDGTTTPLTAFVPKIHSGLEVAKYDQNPVLSGTPEQVSRLFLQKPPATKAEEDDVDVQAIVDSLCDE